MSLELVAKVLISVLAGVAALVVTFRMAFTKPTMICGRCQCFTNQCECSGVDMKLDELVEEWLRDDDPTIRDCGLDLRGVLNDRKDWSPLSAQPNVDGD